MLAGTVQGRRRHSAQADGGYVGDLSDVSWVADERLWIVDGIRALTGLDDDYLKYRGLTKSCSVRHGLSSMLPSSLHNWVGDNNSLHRWQFPTYRQRGCGVGAMKSEL